MTGLIRNNFYSMESNLKMTLLVAAVLAGIGGLLNSQRVYTEIIAIQVILFVINSGTSLKADETAKWNKFEITLPVDRSAIIGAKYISMAVLALLGLTAGGLTVILMKGLGRQIDYGSAIWGFGFGLSVALAMMAFMYPAMLKIGADKSEIIICMAAFCAVVFIGITERLMAPLIGFKNFKYPVNGIVLSSVSLVLFLVSYFVALRIHRKKEFQ